MIIEIEKEEEHLFKITIDGETYTVERYKDEDILYSHEIVDLPATMLTMLESIVEHYDSTWFEEN